MIHMPDRPVAVSYPTPKRPDDPLVIHAMCVCGDPNCAFTASDMYRWVWCKWQGGLPSFVSARDGWIDDTDPKYAEVM
jgi:hypothetical protein